MSREVASLLAARLVVLLLALASRDGCKMATAGVLVGNWIVNASLAWCVGDTSPWLVYLVTDYLSALLIYIAMCSHWQRAVLAVYACELIAHAAYGASSKSGWADWYYWWALYYGGWAQVASIGAWMAYDRLGSGRRGAFSDLPRRYARTTTAAKKSAER